MAATQAGTESVVIPSPETMAKDRSWVLPVIMVMMTVFVAILVLMGWTAVIPKMQEAWGVTLADMGLFLGIGGIATVLLSVPFGELTNRIGVKKALIVTQILMIVGMSIVALSSALPMGVVGRFIAMAGCTVTMVPAMTALATVAPPRILATLMALMTVVSAVAVVIGQMLFGAVIGAAYGWQATHWAIAGVAVVSLVLFALFFNPKPMAASAAASAESQAQAAEFGRAAAAAPSAYKNPQVWLLAIGLQLACASGLLASSFIALPLAKLFNMDAQGIATIASIGALLSIPVMLGTGFISDKTGKRKMVALVCIVGAIALLLGLNSPSVTLFSICAIGLSAIGSGPINAILSAAFPTVHPHANVASAYGLSMTIGGVMAYLVPQGLGSLADATGSFTVGWIVLTAAVALGAVLVAMVKTK